MLNSYRMMDTEALVEAGLAAGNDLAQALAERLDDTDAALGMADHLAGEVADLNRQLADAEADLAEYRSPSLTGGACAQ